MPLDKAASPIRRCATIISSSPPSRRLEEGEAVPHRLHLFPHFPHLRLLSPPSLPLPPNLAMPSSPGHHRKINASVSSTISSFPASRCSTNGGGRDWEVRCGAERFMRADHVGLATNKYGVAERPEVVEMVMCFCNANRLVMSFAVVPLAARYGWSSSFVGIVQWVARGAARRMQAENYPHEFS